MVSNTHWWTNMFTQIWFAIVFMAVTGNCLQCYDTTKIKHSVLLATNSTWKYCVYSQFVNNNNRQREKPSLFGLGTAEEDLNLYDRTFAQSIRGYAVLSSCVFERYPAGMLTKQQEEMEGPQFFFRCMCNFDGCNKASTFDNYLRHIKNENENEIRKKNK